MDDFWSTKLFSSPRPHRSASELAPSGHQTSQEKVLVTSSRPDGFDITWCESNIHKNWEWDDVEALEREEFNANAGNWNGNVDRDVLQVSESSGESQNWDFGVSGENLSPSLQTSYAAVSKPQKLDSFLEAFLSHPKGFRKGAITTAPFFNLPSSALSPPLTPHSPPVSSGRSPSQGGDGNEALPFLHSSGMRWMFPTGSDEPSNTGRSLSSKSRRVPRRSSHGKAPGKVALKIYTGTPFPSILHSGKGERAHYTPRPLLNPARSGTGLFSSILSTQSREEDERGNVAWVNIGSDFQAVIPSLNSAENEDELNSEQFLWKSPEERGRSHDQVEQLLLMCCSSCVPGGGCNIELALHSLHACKANIMAALKMLLFKSTSPTGDYHYSGSDVWTHKEKNDFNGALFEHGKNFALIQKKVKTKTQSQCVEFYYLTTKHQAKRIKRVEPEDRDETEQHKSVTSSCPPSEEEVLPAPPSFASFPCLKCGKIFSKVKSRNAHMKIHRKLSKPWSGRILPQHVAPYLDTSHAYSHHSGYVSVGDASMQVPSYTYTHASSPNFQVGTIVDLSGSYQRTPSYAPVFNQSWHSVM
ncbi:zinc finger protein 541-like [Corythoichthys intestinalis]|uniref:zinc finger protein 541-like n=1 Tax=Corythoichthys intestinalis TaxID=161448 RepID=UPI0025A4EC28|nr:zinc finger protein 541-like [Corythoichthys intestinalis]XP_057711733.1 zinc finger protein 541-like [Corythoichthys intestinalis]